MGLFVQDIKLGLSSDAYLLEKATLPTLNRDKINLTVAPGTVAIVGGEKYKGQEVPYKLTRGIVGLKNGAEVFLYPDKNFDGVSLQFFGGQHTLSFSATPTAKGTFAVVGTAFIEISDYKDLAKFFNRSLTVEDLKQELMAKDSVVKAHLSNETMSAIKALIKDGMTEDALCAVLNDEIASKIRKTASLLTNMGLLLSSRAITFKLNTLDQAAEAQEKLNRKSVDKAMSEFDKDELDRQERREAAERQHEIDKIRAQRTNISENTDTKNVNTNTNGGNVTIVNDKEKDKDKKSEGEQTAKFCPECGVKLTGKVKFCPECGKKL